MRMLTMPRLGQTMDHGTVLRHVVAARELFAEGDVLYVVETEKVEVDVEARAPGRMMRWLAAEGVERDVGDPIAIMADPNESPADDDVAAFIGTYRLGEGADDDVEPSEPVTSARAEPATGGRVRAMPKARAMAAEHGLDLAAIAAGVGDRPVTPADVRAQVELRTPTISPDPTAAPDGPSNLGDEVEQLVGPRRAMARQMAASWATIPHFVESVLVDATSLVAVRRRSGPRGARPPTVTAYLAAALATVCVEVPVLHASLVGEALRRHADVNMNVAIDTPHGLMAPVIHCIQSLAVHEIAVRLDDLASRAVAASSASTTCRAATSRCRTSAPSESTPGYLSSSRGRSPCCSPEPSWRGRSWTTDRLSSADDVAVAGMRPPGHRRSHGGTRADFDQPALQR